MTTIHNFIPEDLKDGLSLLAETGEWRSKIRNNSDDEFDLSEVYASDYGSDSDEEEFAEEL